MDPVRQKILEMVSDAEIVHLAKGLVAIPSFQDEETGVSSFVKEFLKRERLEVQMQEVEPGRFQAIGWLRGSEKGPLLAFNGHVDIDPPPMGYEGDPFKPFVEGNRLYGQGISNMKGGVAAQLMAAVALKRSEVELRGSLVVENLVGELQGGVGTSYTLEQGIRPDYAIVTESSGLDIVRKSGTSIALLISTLGERRQAEPLRYPIEPINAVEKMCKVIQTLKTMRFSCTPDPELPSLPLVNVGSILGGQGRDYIINRHTFSAEYCTIAVDVKGPIGMGAETVKRDVEEALDRLHDPELRYEVEIPPETYRRPWRIRKHVLDGYSIPMEMRLVRSIFANQKALIGKVPGERLMLASDAAGLLNRVGAEAVTYGPRAGVEKEPIRTYCEIDSLVTCSRVLVLTALDLLG